VTGDSKMKPEEKKKTIKRYEERLQKYGVSAQAMGWRDKEQQYMRFVVLAAIGDLNNCSVLDVGCGFGDFYDFLKGKGLNVRYTGYDISDKLIEIAQQKHPEATFEVKDILEEESHEKFDYVVSSGILNARLSDNEGYVRGMLRQCFELCNIGVAMNIMSNYVDYKEEDLHYYSPEHIFAFCKTLTKRAALRHDYMPFEFTVYLYKDDNIDDRHIFSQAYNEWKGR